MEGVLGEGATPLAPLANLKNDFSKVFQFYLDKSTPLPVHRWLGTLAVVMIYVLRVYLLQGFYIVTYGLGIYVLNLLIGFLSPKVDPELEALDGAELPTKESDEFRPFIRRLPEFKFWYAITKAFCVAFLMTFFSLFDIPVFWPILLCYWVVFFVLTMKRQIMHLIKYKYVPLNIGKQIEHKMAYNTEIMLTHIKMPLPDMTAAALAMDESILDADQVENLIKFCPAKEEIEPLKAAALAMDESILDADQVENLIKFCPAKEEIEPLKAAALAMDESILDADQVENLIKFCLAKEEIEPLKAAALAMDESILDADQVENLIKFCPAKEEIEPLKAAALAMDESILDADQVENLIKFCPAKEEIEPLKFFMELMRVPRVESKLRVFLFKIQFNSQISDFRKSLNAVNVACDEVRNSHKLKEIMSRILFLRNTLNQGTARGSAVGFKLDSLLKLTDTRATNNKMTLMHYLCKVFADKLPHLLDFHEDLVSLEAASKIQLKSLAEEMQAINKGLDKLKQELNASKNDGPVSEVFVKTLKEFIGVAATEGTSVQNLYSVAGKNADALALYFNEDPARCPFEQVTATLLNFVRMFRKANEENCKQDELEKKRKLEVELERQRESI